MTAINTNAGAIWNKAPGQTVYLRALWSDAWAAETYLYANSLAKRASPEISSAELVYDYGIARQLAANGFAVHEPQSLVGWYVKIVVEQFDSNGNATTPITWYGVILEEGDGRQGAVADATGTARLTGKQSFMAFGLEALLEREVVRASTVAGAEGEQELGRPLGFNEPPSRSEDALQGNRSSAPGELGAYVFAADLAGADEWSARDIAQYLLAYRSPRNGIGLAPVPFTVDPASLGQLASWQHPRIPVARQTVKELLDEAISRQRLTGYYLDVDAAGDAVVYPFTFAETDIVVGASFIEANQNQVSLDFDNAFDVEQAVVKSSYMQQYDQVLVRGGRKGACFTVSFKDATLEADWPSSLETEYETAASGAGDYPGVSRWAESQQRNRLWRQADKYKRVYAWFKLPDDWDGTAGDGENGETKLPAITVDDQPDQAAPFWLPGLLFRPYLPLYTDHDYSGSKIGDGSVVDDTPSGRRAERLRPLAFFRVLTPDGTTRYQHVEKPVESDKTDKHSLGSSQWRCSLRMQDRSLGLELRVHGAPQHVLAKTDFTAADATDLTPVVDFRDNLLATVYLHTDHYLEASFPESVSGLDWVRRLHIDYGEDGRLDYVAPNTVVGIADGVLQRSDGGYVRDDRQRMRDLAEAAYQWYSPKRQAFTLIYRQISGAFQLGMLITEIGSGANAEAVRTPITSIEWDLIAGTTTIQTGFAELDVLQFSGAVPLGAAAGIGGGF